MGYSTSGIVPVVGLPLFFHDCFILGKSFTLPASHSSHLQNENNNDTSPTGRLCTLMR